MITKKCTTSGQEFIITDEDQTFYQKMDVPVPTLCPEERQRRRLAWRHGGELFRDTCALSGKGIISMYEPDQGLTVYDQEVWWGDDWDPLVYGQDFDFTKPAFPQFLALSKAVPKIALVSTNSINSKYTNHTLNHKNCYLVFGGADNEDCLHGYFVQGCRDVVDADSVVGCELCFDIIASLNCYRCAHVTHSQNCNDCFLIDDCIGCQDCIACVGLTQKKHHILNKKYTAADFKKIKTELQLGRYGAQQKMIDQFQALKAKTPQPATHQYNCEDCTGDHLFNSRNLTDCYDCKNSEDCKYVSFTPNGLDSYDCTFSAPVGVQHCYETVSSLGQEILGAMLVWRSDNVAYSVECHNSSNLLGCAGLRNQKNVILNQPHTVQEYEALFKKIKNHMIETGEWGEFFPVQASPYAYNRSLAQTLLPLDKVEAQRRGYTWSADTEKASYEGSAYEIPSDISQVDGEITEKILICASTGANYRLSKAELAFYRKMGLPIPRLCPEMRKNKRLQRRNSRKLFTHDCAACKKAIETTFAPDRLEKVLCKKCYLETVT